MHLADPESALSLIEASRRLSERKDGPVLEFHEASQSLVPHGQASDPIRTIVSNLSKKIEAKEITQLKNTIEEQALEFDLQLDRERAQFERALQANKELENCIARLVEEVDILNLKLAWEKAGN
jgi:hypothetical protein